MSEAPVTYEVNLVPAKEIEKEFDDWLEGHVVDMLRLPGFLTAVVRRSEDPVTGEIQRTVQYELRDRAALDAYLSDHAEEMRRHGLDRFGDRFRATRRVLDRGHRLSASGPYGGCANCDAPLAGQYCALCGQRARGRMITLWELLKEVSEVLTTLDSRLWRTLEFLLLRPGRLTADYLKGRRARYAPPLRLFLGASLIFFFAVAVGNRLDLDGGLKIQVGDDPEVAAPAGDEDAPPGQAASGDEPAAAAPETEPAAPVTEPAAPETEPAATEDPCGDLSVDLTSGNARLEAFLSEDRLRAVCRKIVDDHGASFGRALLDNIPVMMFLFLPLMAVVMKLLYLFTGRYYVEHLLFLVHYHAFFYLAVTFALVAGWIFNGQRLPEWPATLLTVVTSIYVPYYLYRAMRLVYGQRRGMTLAKYFALVLAYFAALLTMFGLTAAVTAFTL
jgi:RNA polymerase-binding transcription factor DksA